MAKRRSVPKDKKTKIPKKYLSGLKGKKRSSRAKLLQSMSKLYKSGATIPQSMFKARVK
ncbi:MAG TPA: hypothetical protein VLB82_09515 [Thermodesulfobacteriota bacterium]|jgi:hypothetical protein|nr:hypothetical protein [Thermodesulfobacteriota bacterium]|tara:strand:+ start:432 stop:608 length:177 start_codon:yes stop_codon:yes gene_type:complete